MIAVALLAAAAVGIFSDVLVSGKYLTPDAIVFSAPPFEAHRPPQVPRPFDHALDDLTYLYHPYLFHARASVRSGHLPAWDPHVGAGRPLGAQQAAPLFPLSWLSYVLPFEASFVFVFMLKMLIAGLGTYLLCRRLKLGAGAAIFGACAFALGNPFVPFLGAGATNTFLLLPWMLLFVNRLVQRAGIADALLLGLVAGGAVYGGHPESWAAAYLIVASYATFELFVAHSDGLGGRRIVSRAGLLALAGLLAICVGALALLPLLELLGQSDRLSRAFKGVDSLKQLTVGAFAPEFWGRHDKHVFQQANFSTLSSIYAGRPYVGALPLLFAGATLVIRAGRERLFFVALAVVSLLGLLLTPLRDVARHVPGLSLVNLQELIWPLAFAVCVLAAFGLQWVLAAPARARRRFFLGLGTLGGVAVLVLVLSRPAMLGSLGSAIGQFPSLRIDTRSADVAALGSVLRLAALTCAGLGLGAYALLRRESPRAFIALVVAITLFDLVTLARGFFPAVSMQTARPATPPAISLADGGSSGARLTGIGFSTFAPNLADKFGVYDTRVEDLPELKRYSLAFTALGGSEQLGLGRTYVTNLTARTTRLLDVFGSRHVLDDGGSRIAGSPQLRVVYARPGERLLRNTQAFPRAWVAYGWQAAPSVSRAVSQLRAAGTATLLRSPVIEGAEGSHPGLRPIDVAAITRSADASVEMRVRAGQPGYLVLNDTFYPGWTARVDGKKTPIQPANVAFRAISVGPGVHRVTFKYEPSTVRFGLILSLLGVVGALAGSFAAGWRHRARRKRTQLRALDLGAEVRAGLAADPTVTIARVSATDLQAEAERYPWYHTLELGDGVVTEGMFDHRPVLERYPLPADLTGMKCLDVATMDGFWAFEMERRGAASVTAIDLEDPEDLDWPASLRGGHDRSMDETKAARFALAKEALGSKVDRVLISAYDLSPELGTFDFVFCGDLLLHLKDPITPVERIRSVCAGSAVIVNVITRFRFHEDKPLAELEGIDHFAWWTTNLAGLVRIVRAAGFDRVEPSETFELPYRGGGDWRGLRGAVRAYV